MFFRFGFEVDKQEIHKYKYQLYLEENNKTRKQKLTQHLELNSNQKLIRKNSSYKHSESCKNNFSTGTENNFRVIILY